jgi:hypothetical protein
MTTAATEWTISEQIWDQALRIADLGFATVPVVRYSSGGTPWTKSVPVGMPKISDKVLDCACYLYQSREAAESGQQFGGTAFLVTIPSEVQGKVFVIAVTNWHVAVRDGFSVLRVNNRAGGVDIFEFGPEDWDFDPRYDVAVRPIRLDPESHKYATVGIHTFVTKDERKRLEVGPGDDVFMVGRFVDHDGGAVNSPSLRFGNISMHPTTVEVPKGKKTEAYCIDMHSGPGYSGSPVFVYRTAGQDLSQGNIVSIGPPLFAFLGIHYAQFPEMWESEKAPTSFRKLSTRCHSSQTESMFAG